jgi:hypothetical protein
MGPTSPGWYVGPWMPDPLSRAERIRKEAAKFSSLDESASSPFLRDYYWRLADRYLALEGKWETLGRQGRTNLRRGDFSVADFGRDSTPSLDRL